MKTANKGLRKVTNSDVSKTSKTSKKKDVEDPYKSMQLQIREKQTTGWRLSPTDEREIKKILHGPKLKKEEYDKLSKGQRDRYSDLFSKGLTLLALDDRQRFIEQIAEITQQETRRSLWELNHMLIMSAIDQLTRKYNRFPSRGEIQTETELSRKTIHKHLKEWFGSDAYSQRKDEYFAMRDNVLARLYLNATAGNTKAARLFHDATAFTAEPPRIQNQHNYLQVNSLTITQEQISQLPEAERNVFIEIVQRFAPVNKSAATQPTDTTT